MSDTKTTTEGEPKPETKAPLLKNTGKVSKAKESEVERKRKEAQEATQKDMAARAAAARAEIEATLERYRCLVVATPKLVHVENGRFAVEAEPIVAAKP